jgi:hypothetical protein
VFYERVDLLVDAIDREAATLPRVDSHYARLAERLDLLEDVLEARLKQLEAVEEGRAGEVFDPIFHRLASIDPFFEPVALLQTDREHCDAFMEEVDRATSGHFQATSDAFAAYPETVHYHLGTRTDFATLEKQFGYELEEQRRYSPPRLIGTEIVPRHGNPDPDRIGTSYVERMNLSIRMHVRRLTRLTNAFSKVWRNHRAALALFFAWYNWCKMHSTLRMTPAMKADLARRPWSMRDLMEAAARA